MHLPAPLQASRTTPRLRLLVLLLASALSLTACNNDSGYDDSITALPAEPAGLGSTDTAPLPSTVE